jgi:hypothetical protein
MSVSLRIRRDSEARWLENDPVPHQGELCMDITNHKIKLGDGFNEWSKLPYLGSSGVDALREEYGNETDFILNYELFK